MNEETKIGKMQFAESMFPASNEELPKIGSDAALAWMRNVPTPWRTLHEHVLDADGQHLFSIKSGNYVPVMVLAERVVACVNAMAGIKNPTSKTVAPENPS